jgi:hypothetical protein
MWNTVYVVYCLDEKIAAFVEEDDACNHVLEDACDDDEVRCNYNIKLEEVTQEILDLMPEEEQAALGVQSYFH